ncbi:MAG: DUF2079 domain-containing protein [Oscillatoriaceae cyanobacterium Prado104]|jgi:uncharacterized membrane protein|nr:DUF2079 domain-containing protein [Oscillatoriaceae cyanobacterium Prado104]
MQNGENFTDPTDPNEGSRVSIGENMQEGRLQLTSSLVWTIAAAVAILFLSSTVRHALFQSTAFDLGIFDQAIYLISQNQTPFSSLMQMHILGDHAAIVHYLLALLYKIYPNVHWLFLVQAVALSSGAWPSWSLACLSGLNREESSAIAFIYLLYPVVFNINLFDFHPEVIALPALLAAILAARLNKFAWFCSAILLILSCKAVLSLTVAAMGCWLLFCEKKMRFGTLALLLGTAWFFIASGKIIPYFSGSEVAGVGRYGYLGNSVLEIALNLVLKPQLVLGKIISFDTLKYLFSLTLPVFWLLLPSRKIGLGYLTGLIPAIPTIFINSLSDLPFQRSLAYQYSIPIVPFLILAAIARSAANQMAETTENLEDLRIKSKETGFFDTKGEDADIFAKKPGFCLTSSEEDEKGNEQQFLKSAILPKSQHQKISSLSFKNLKFPKLWLGIKLPKAIIIWSLMIFLFLGEYKDFFLYLNRLDTWQATREAIAQIRPQSSILTDNRLAPQFAHRPTVKLLSQVSLQTNLAEFEYILFNLRHPWPDTAKLGESLAKQLKDSPAFKLIYQQNEVLLFKRTAA